MCIDQSTRGTEDQLRATWDRFPLGACAEFTGERHRNLNTVWIYSIQREPVADKTAETAFGLKTRRYMRIGEQ